MVVAPPKVSTKRRPKQKGAVTPLREANDSTAQEKPGRKGTKRGKFRGGRDQGEVSGEYLTVPEVAAELRLSKRTAYYLISIGEIPHVRVGRSIRIYRSTLETWRRRREESSKKKRPAQRQSDTDLYPHQEAV